MLRGKAHELLYVFSQKEPKGEFVIIIQGTDIEINQDNIIDISKAIELVNELIKKGDKKTFAIKKVCAKTGINRKELYDHLKNN